MNRAPVRYANCTSVKTFQKQTPLCLPSPASPSQAPRTEAPCAWSPLSPPGPSEAPKPGAHRGERIHPPTRFSKLTDPTGGGKNRVGRDAVRPLSDQRPLWPGEGSTDVSDAGLSHPGAALQAAWAEGGREGGWVRMGAACLSVPGRVQKCPPPARHTGRTREGLLPPQATCSPQTAPSPCPQGDGLEAGPLPRIRGNPTPREGELFPPQPPGPWTVPNTSGFSHPQLNRGLGAYRSSGYACPSLPLIPKKQEPSTVLYSF